MDIQARQINDKHSKDFLRRTWNDDDKERFNTILKDRMFFKNKKYIQNEKLIFLILLMQLIFTGTLREP